EDVTTNEITARRIHIDAPAQPVIRTYANIRLVLDQSDLPVGARRTSQRIYGLLATAVGRVQGKDPDLVTFQEFGEADCLVVVVGEELRVGTAGAEHSGDVMVESTIDELDPGGISRLIEALLSAGAEDAWVVPAVGRSGASRSNVRTVGPARMAERVARVIAS